MGSRDTSLITMISYLNTNSCTTCLSNTWYLPLHCFQPFNWSIQLTTHVLLLNMQPYSSESVEFLTISMPFLLECVGKCFLFTEWVNVHEQQVRQTTSLRLRAMATRGTQLKCVGCPIWLGGCKKLQNSSGLLWMCVWNSVRTLNDVTLDHI